MSDVLSFTPQGVPVLNGNPLPQTAPSGSGIWYADPSWEGLVLIRNGGEFYFQDASRGGSKTFTLDPVGLNNLNTYAQSINSGVSIRGFGSHNSDHVAFQMAATDVTPGNIRITNDFGLSLSPESRVQIIPGRGTEFNLVSSGSLRGLAPMFDHAIDAAEQAGNPFIPGLTEEGVRLALQTNVQSAVALERGTSQANEGIPAVKQRTTDLAVPPR